ncbi:Lactate utilization protein B, partial [termite gut metagenome]
DQIYRWRQDLDTLGHADSMKKFMSKGMKYLFGHSALYNTTLKFAPIANSLPRFLTYNGLNEWGKGRELPRFGESFTSLWKKGKVQKAKK